MRQSLSDRLPRVVREIILSNKNYGELCLSLKTSLPIFLEFIFILKMDSRKII